MKWIALVKITDWQMLHSWHSGSCDTYKSKANLETKEQAEEFINEVEKLYESHYNIHRSDSDKYRLKPCILSYDESQSENVENFFRYM
jgi:hypothetical protein